jgi:hemolysin activation/secretion protein
LTNNIATFNRGAASRFNVHAYVVEGDKALTTNAPTGVLSRFTGTNIGLAEIIRAASDLQLEYRNRGYGTISVSIAQQRITNGIVTLNVFQGLQPQILISGRRYSTNDLAILAAQLASNVATNAATNVSATVQTNVEPHFNLRGYVVEGNTLLSTNVVQAILLKYTGTNVSLPEILKGASELQLEYRTRGYPTVTVAIPQQQITNGTITLHVFQGRLAEIRVVGNRYFSSNNVMRTMPSLHTNVILNGTLFQAELDRANANQDRQIYPQIEPGAETDTTDLILKVKDRLPLHAKLEFNNENTPGTPDLRINSSAVYNNLWQHENSLGLQYSFSPEAYKSGNRHWNFYDLPVVANYSGFYRLPLGDFEALENAVAANPGTFGYDEATHRFNLPPPSGRVELNVYASGSSIDTGLMTLVNRTIANTNGISVVEHDVQQDVTVNNSLGLRLSTPVRTGKWITTFSGGLDVKSYDLQSHKTNNFIFTVTSVNNGITNISVSTVPSPVPPPLGLTHQAVDYLPFSFRWDARRPDKSGSTAFGLGYSPNFSGRIFGNNQHDFATIAGSTNANGYYHIINGNISRDQHVYKDWVLSVRVDGQWASQPLISNEQFGLAGINAVRGYQEGLVYGDVGWRITTEQRTPPYILGFAYAKNPLTMRGAVFMDYGQAYWLDPHGRKSPINLWGTGLGGVASIGLNWEIRLLCGFPLLDAGSTEAGQPRFDFSLSTQF